MWWGLRGSQVSMRRSEDRQHPAHPGCYLRWLISVWLQLSLSYLHPGWTDVTVCQCLTSVREIEEGGDLGTDTTSPPTTSVCGHWTSFPGEGGRCPSSGAWVCPGLALHHSRPRQCGAGEERERHLVRLLIMNSLIRLELQPPPLQHNCIHFLIWINQVLSIE